MVIDQPPAFSWGDEKLKCKNIRCENEVEIKHQVYCSRDCSPYGYLCKANYVAPRKKTAKKKSRYKANAPWLKYSRKPKPEDFIG